MAKMSTGTALGVFGLGVAWFVLWLVIAILAPWSNKITPPVDAHRFFSASQYQMLFPPPGRPTFDPNHPNPQFSLSPTQKAELQNWGLNGCVTTDGTAAQDTGLFAGGCFCEKAPAMRAVFRPGFAVQPSNTLSTLSLSIVGLIILGFLLFADAPKQSNFMTETYFFPICYAAMTIILGPFSMMLHLGLRNWGGWFDGLSLIIWFGFVACYSWFRFIVAVTGSTPSRCPATAKYWFLGAWLLAIVIPAALTAPGSVMDSTWWYLILGGLALVGELALWILRLILLRSPSTAMAVPAGTSWTPSGASSWWSNLPWDTGGRSWFLGGGITFALALTIWFLSFTRKPLCAPDSWFQGHAIFHTLSAFAVAFLYKYYRHEGEAPAVGGS